MLAIRCVEFTTPHEIPTLREAWKRLRQMQRTSVGCHQPVHEVIDERGRLQLVFGVQRAEPVSLELMVEGFGPSFLLPYLVERTPVSGTIIERTQLGMLLHWAREHDLLAEAHRLVMQKRRGRLVWMTTTQRDWMTKTSRRPQRGRHHDSWAIREKYVRITGGGEPEWRG